MLTVTKEVNMLCRLPYMYKLHPQVYNLQTHQVTCSSSVEAFHAAQEGDRPTGGGVVRLRGPRTAQTALVVTGGHVL